jgi:tRNA 2-selenouridine synthase
MPGYISIDDFFDLRRSTTVVDVRSPSEFSKAHIPGATNIPLFSDEERADVGTTYKQKGRKAAVKLGLSMAGPKMLEKAEAAEQIAGPGKQLIVHCWRGGMRSENMAWLFSRLDIDCYVLKGGYKTYRHFAKSYLKKPLVVKMLGGLTGTGKTDLLHALSREGEQIIDLENLANHKGSAFGTIGEDPQPSTEQFENLLFEALFELNIDKPIWVEDESPMIGRIHIPDEFYRIMRNSPVFKLELDKKHRIQRLVDQYVQSDPNALKNAIQKIRKRLGGEKTKIAIDAINQGDYHSAANIALTYYDKTYLYGLSKRNQSQIFPVKFSEDKPEKNVKILKEQAYSVVQ